MTDKVVHGFVALVAGGNKEASKLESRRYHVVMLLKEIGDIFANRGGDTRGYLSFDFPECQILQELLLVEEERLRHL